MAPTADHGGAGRRPPAPPVSGPSFDDMPAERTTPTGWERRRSRSCGGHATRTGIRRVRYGDGAGDEDGAGDTDDADDELAGQAARTRRRR